MQTQETKNQNGTRARHNGASLNRTVAPPIDILENDEEVVILADVPGASLDSIVVEVHGSQLTIEATSATLPEGRSLRRTVSLPTKLDAERVGASLDAGVLRVRLPKRAEERPRRIEVKSQ